MISKRKTLLRGVFIAGGCLAALLGFALYNSPPDRIDVQKIETLLEAEKWKEADIETGKAIVLIVTRRNAIQRRLSTLVGEPIYTSEEIKTASCEDLRTINKLWEDYSNGRFGFTTQYKVWLENYPRNSVPKDYKYSHYLEQGYKAFESRVGWRKNGQFEEYPKALDLSIDAPKGQFPSWIWMAEGKEGMAGKPYRNLDVKLKTMLEHVAICERSNPASLNR